MSTCPPSVRRWIWIGLGAVLVLWVAYLVREIWLPLAIAFLIAMVLDPVVDRMERLGMSRLFATALIFFLFFASLAVAVYYAAPAIADQAQRISGQVSQYIPVEGNQTHAQRSLDRALRRAHLPPYARMAVQRATEQLSHALAANTAWVSAHAMDIVSNLIWLVIIPIVTFYALKDFHIILAKALLLVPRERRELVQTLVAEVTTIFARFLRGLALVSALNGLSSWLVFELIHLPNAFTLGAIAGVLYSVPYFGAIITVILVCAVAFIAGGVQYMLIVLAANVLLHQVLFDQVISPRILGGQVGLHPILSIIALLVGNVLLGIVGMLLAVPVAASIQLIVLVLVPKLAHDIDIPAAVRENDDTVGELSETTKAEHVEEEATPGLHRSVSEAVQRIEEKEQDADHASAA